MSERDVMSRIRPIILYGAGALIAFGFLSAAFAGSADVVGVESQKKGPDVYDFQITIRSDDTDQHHYADRVEAVGPNGTIYGTRTFEAPHEVPQPFTTDMSNVWVPGVVNSITFRVHFTTTGFDGVSMDVKLGAR